MSEMSLEDAFAEYAEISLEMSNSFEPDGPIMWTLEEVAEAYAIPLAELRGEACDDSSTP